MPYPLQPSIGLALGGGSARGWAHIGGELETLGVHVHMVAGTSIAPWRVRSMPAERSASSRTGSPD